MITFEINENSYSFPTSWSDVTLSQYIEIMKLNEEKNIVYQIKLISILSKCEIEILRECGNILIAELIQIMNKFVYTIPSLEIENDFFIFKNVKYNIKGILESQFGQFLDFDHYMTNVSKETDDNLSKFLQELDNLKYMIAILCWQDGEEKYDDKKMLQRAEEFKELPIDLIFGLKFFFTNRYAQHMITSHGFSEVHLHVQNQLNDFINFIQTMAGETSS